LIDLMYKMRHYVLLKKFSVKPKKPQEFFAKTYDTQKGS